MAQVTIRTLADLARIEDALASTAAATMAVLRAQLAEDALSALAVLKFATPGCDPLDHSRELHVIEQINQTFTYLASIEGARFLLSHHPERGPFTLNLGTAPGSDIVSADGSVAAEVFAATSPDSNDKLRKDIAKVLAVPALHRYVFYLSPVAARMETADGVTVVRLMHRSLNALPTSVPPIARTEPRAPKTAEGSVAEGLSRLCPGCGEHKFQRWPWGWDAHAAHTCRALAAVGHQERKAEFRRRFADAFAVR